jgi:hypothetical protein
MLNLSISVDNPNRILRSRRRSTSEQFLHFRDHVTAVGFGWSKQRTRVRATYGRIQPASRGPYLVLPGEVQRPASSAAARAATARTAWCASIRPAPNPESRGFWPSRWAVDQCHNKG